MNQSRKRVIHWSPHKETPNRFMVVANDMRLYTFIEGDQNNRTTSSSISSSASSSQKKSGGALAPKKASIQLNYIIPANSQLARCTTWATNPSTPDWVAMGYINGRVAVVHLPQMVTVQNKITLENEELPLWIVHASGTGMNVLQPKDSVFQWFIPKYQRACNAVAFQYSTSATSLVAEALDKIRNDDSLYIWDPNRLPPPPPAPPSSPTMGKKSVRLYVVGV
jgi:hypothetical protein